VARFLVGSARVAAGEDGLLDDGAPDCAIVDARDDARDDAPTAAAAGATAVPGLLRELDLQVCIPRQPLNAVCTNEQWADVHDQIAELIKAHKTTLVFVSTRRLAERTAYSLAERLGEGAVMAHHGSLSRTMRLRVEDRLKKGELQAVVATASLELGIDIGAIDLVCQLGSPRAIATFLQRVGRANHRPDKSAVPRGRLFALTRDELCECAALVRAIAAGQLDRQRVQDGPLDVLAQQVVAICASAEQTEDELFQLCRRAWPFRDLGEPEFHKVLGVLAEGVATRRGRPSAHLHWDRVNRLLRGRRGAHLYALQNGGTIPEPADYEIVSEKDETVLGRLDEEFVVESSAGDVFLLGSSAWRLRRIQGSRAYVVDAGGAAPTVPFWAGEAPGRTFELSQAVAALRREVEDALVAPTPQVEALEQKLQRECKISAEAAQQVRDYLQAARLSLGRLPTQEVLIAERFFDEGGGMQLVLHMPFGARQNRAFGLALRKKFCRAFNFELQAAATDDGVLLSLGETHSFPLETVWQFLSAPRIAEVLSQAVLGAPVFQPHFRHVATRALQIPRQRGGKKLPPPIVRILTEDLLAAVFPNAAACPENLPGGDIEIPDHPLVRETLRECLHEVMDLPGLQRLLGAIAAGAVQVLACDTAEPSPLSHHLLAAAPYAFLDDTPAEERRTRAVAVRHGKGGHLSDEVLAHTPQAGLDPESVAAVKAAAWPRLRSADELHDALLGLYYLPQAQLDFLTLHAAAVEELVQARRATLLHVGAFCALVASERAAAVRTLFTAVAAQTGGRPPQLVPAPPTLASDAAGADDLGADERVLVEVVRGWLAVTGPWDAADLAFALHLPEDRIDAALLALEAEGMALRGRFLPAADGAPRREQFCDRRLLLQIHRHMKQKFRRSIEPATPAQLWQLLARWQHAWPGTQLGGSSGLLRVLHKLQGFVAGAASFEEDLLPLRLRGYLPEWLDGLCLSGEVAWGRLRPGSGEGRFGRSTPISLWRRGDADFLVPPRPPFADWLAKSRAATGPATATNAGARLSPLAEALGEVLDRRGARFFAELCRDAGRPAKEVAGALGELCAAGLCTSDGFSGLRLLLGQTDASGSVAGQVAMAAGRWALIEGPREAADTARGPVAVSRTRFRGALPLLGDEADWDNPALLESWAHQYLLRYGVLTRELLSREPLGPPLYLVLPVLRRLEARGLVRSGYFVAGLSGEQFATPEALEGLALVRKQQALAPAPVEVRISAADPLNLAGILFPGPKAASTGSALLLYRDGEPVGVVTDEGSAQSA
jgi:ATP-dependent Lhr-like helicase